MVSLVMLAGSLTKMTSYMEMVGRTNTNLQIYKMKFLPPLLQQDQAPDGLLGDSKEQVKVIIGFFKQGDVAWQAA